MKRRTFLELTGTAAAGITVGAVGLKVLLPPKQDAAPLSEDHLGLVRDGQALSICDGCAAGCSVRVRTADSRLYGVLGNPSCPIGAGGVCARGLAGVEAYYDPDRVIAPAARAGSRGAGQWTRQTWDEALAPIVQATRRLVSSGHGDRIGVILSSPAGSRHAVAEHVLAAFGSPHVYQTDPLRDESAAAAAAFSLGNAQPLSYDLDSTDLLLSFGTPVLEGWLSPSFVHSRFGRGRRRAEDPLTFIQVSSRLSPTAMRADQWVRCEPGQEPLVALGIVGALLREDLVDEAALRGLLGLQDTQNPDGEVQRGFGYVIRYAHSPHAVFRDTGVAEVEVLELARRFARAKYPVAVGERLAGSAGVLGLAAVNLINAVMGRIGTRGGVRIPQRAPLSALPGAVPAPRGRLDRAPVAGLDGGNIWRVLGALGPDGRQPPFDVLFIEDGAAMGDIGPGDPAYALLAQIPLIVSLTTSLDASSQVADVLLPSTLAFEQTSDVVVSPGAFVAVAAAHAALPPLGEARPPEEVLLEIGRESMPRGPWTLKTADEVVRHRLGGLFRARRGIPYSSPFRQDWARQMESAGWWAPIAETQEAFVAKIFEHGGWVDPYAAESPPSARHPYRVAAGADALKFDPSTLFVRALRGKPSEPRAERGSYEAGPETLRLVPFPVGVLIGRGSPNRPSLLELAGPHAEAAYRPWAELNPTDADRLGIESGARVRISTASGEIIVLARVWAGVRPGTVAVAQAPSGVGAGRWATGWRGGGEALARGVFGALVGARTNIGMGVRVQPTDEEVG